MHIWKNLSKARRLKTRLVCYKYSWEVWWTRDAKKSLQFSPSFKFEDSIPHKLAKYEIDGTSEIPISELSSYSEKICKFNLLQAFIQNIRFSIFFMYLKKFKSPARATFKNSKIYLWIGESSEIKPKPITQKIPILSPWMNWKNLCPNSSFTEYT